MELAHKHVLAQIVTLAFVAAVFFLQRDVLLTVLPLLAVAAWAYMIWMVHRSRRARAQVARASGSVHPDRSVPAVPAITGDVVPPPETSTIDPTEMEHYLASRIVGQDLVGSQLARGIYRRMAQSRRGKPVFTALLSGPTGTGKTEFAKAVASFLYGDSQALFRVDCANVIGEAGLQTLIGSPKGYAGSTTWGALTDFLRSNPRSVLLFDELEKAVPTPNAPMAKLLLSLLDEGICTEQSDGSRVSAEDAVILMTSNAAQDRLRAVFERYRSNPEELVRATKDTLRDHFAPEFLARIDLVTTLCPLDTEAKAHIVALHTARIGSNYGLDVTEIDASFVNEAIHLWATMEGYGTREVIRWIEQNIADELIEAKKSEATRVRVAWADAGVVVEAHERAS